MQTDVTRNPNPVRGRLSRFLRATADLYVQGAKSMTLGKTLWKIIALKLLVFFAVFKLFFFPDVLEKAYDTDSQRADHVIGVLAGEGR